MCNLPGPEIQPMSSTLARSDKVMSFSRARLFATPWTVAYKTPLSMEFSRQKYWSGLPFPSPGDLSNPGIEPRSPALQVDSLPLEPPGNPKQLLAVNYLTNAGL